MRKFLIALASLVALVAAAFAIWIFGGRELLSIIDRYWTVETVAARINSVAYEGPGSGGILMVNDLRLSLNERSAGISPSIGSTKDGQLALAIGGKVFPFGPSQSISENEGEKLATVPPAGDEAFLTIRRSVLSWPSSFDFNFMTGQSPSWKRHVYYRVDWRKQSGATLKMLWRYEQYFDGANGWGSGFMTRQGSTGLIEVDIHP
jgi:hypothetical protein